jgi:hypothetical protein
MKYELAYSFAQLLSYYGTARPVLIVSNSNFGVLFYTSGSYTQVVYSTPKEISRLFCNLLSNEGRA